MDHRRLDFADGWRPAGAWWRLAATLLDMAMYCGLCALLAIPVSQKFDWSAAWGGIDQFARATSDPQWLAHASGILGLWIALWWCYFVVGWGLLGATPGKWAFGLRIIDYRQRCPIGVARALLLEPLERSRLAVVPVALVIGGGIVGVATAFWLSRAGLDTVLGNKAEDPD